MTYTEIQTKLKWIEDLEYLLSRNLSLQEKDIVINYGKKELLEKLHLEDKEIYDMFQMMSKIVSCLFTESSEKYEEELNKATILVGETFKRIGEDILAYKKLNQSKEEEHIDTIDSVIAKLKKGETLELEDKLLDEVIDYLWKSEDNIRIEVKNNKICLK